MSDSNHSSKFTVLVVVALACCRDRTASRGNTQPSSKSFNVHIRIILILCFMQRLSYGESTSNIIRAVKYDEFTLNFEYE